METNINLMWHLFIFSLLSPTFFFHWQCSGLNMRLENSELYTSGIKKEKNKQFPDIYT